MIHIRLYLLMVFILMLSSCKNTPSANTSGDKLQVVATTSLIAEMVSEIGGDAIRVEGLMGAGVDPHLYKASEGDVNKLFQADMIFYNGLHLEGKMQDVLENMERQGIEIVAVSDTIGRDRLIASANFASNYDPHIWFDVSNWKLASGFIANILSKRDPDNRATYASNAARYLAHLDSTETLITNRIAELPADRRILITAHDAFNYFGRAYGFEVLGLQGISTATEAGVQDVQNLAALIVERRIKAIFVETSVPRRNIEALQEAVRNRGFEVTIGGSLFSDALGNPGTREGTYPGMVLYNVNTIVNALKD